jgi:hypothetical protein
MATARTVVFIKNINLPSCIHCKYFEKTTLQMPTGRCVLFGEKDVVTDVIQHELARDCRLDENKCGKFATHFKKYELFK